MTRWGVRIAGGSSLLAAVVAGALVASAGAAFSAPFTVSAGGEDARHQHVAIDSEGDAVFTWVRFDGANWRVQTRTRSAAGNLGPIQTLSATGQDAHFPEVAVDADGDAVFTWQRLDGLVSRVQARARSAAGVLSPTQTLSAAGQDAFSPQVAVDADGDAVFSWHRSDGVAQRVQARARSAAGALSPIQTLSAPGRDANVSRVAIDAGGDATFAWIRTQSNGINYGIQTVTRSAAGTLSAVQNLSVAGQDADQPKVAVDADGDAVFTWRRVDDSRVQTRARSAAGALTAVQTISAAGQDAAGPQVDVDLDGDAVFAWRRSDGAASRIQARARTSAGVVGPTQTVSPPGEDAFNGDLAVDADGDAVIIWTRSDGTNSRVQARTRSAAGTLGTVRTLSAAGQDAADPASRPRVAIDPDGDAVVAWQRSDGTNDRIQGAVGP